MEPRPEPVNTLTDAALIRLIRERRQDALGELYDRYASTLLGLARRIVGNHADAEEVLQEVFLYVWNQAESYNSSRAAVSTWLVLVTRSRALDRLRSRKVIERGLAALEAKKSAQYTSPEGASNVLRDERRQRVLEEMAHLPPEQRQVVELFFLHGLTQTEIARRMGVPVGTVKTRNLLALKKLRKALRDELRELL